MDQVASCLAFQHHLLVVQEGYLPVLEEVCHLEWVASVVVPHSGSVAWPFQVGQEGQMGQMVASYLGLKLVASQEALLLLDVEASVR